MSLSADSRSASHLIKGCTPNTAYMVDRKYIIVHRVSITVMLIVTSIIICSCVPFIVLPTNIAIFGGYHNIIINGTMRLTTRIGCCAHLIILVAASTTLYVDYRITIILLNIIITDVDIDRTTIVRYRIHRSTWATNVGITWRDYLNLTGIIMPNRDVSKATVRP